jgi:hypothetical protein
MPPVVSNVRGGGLPMRSVIVTVLPTTPPMRDRSARAANS